MATTKKRGPLFSIMILLAFGGLATTGLLGWNWLNGLVCRSIQVSDNIHTDSSEVIAAARVDTGTALFGIDPELIADRVQRLPWVKSADVMRLPPSTLSIEIEERVPVALAIGRDGMPAAHLDAEGYVLPITEHSSFDLPLITGARLPANPAEPVPSPEVRELLHSIAALEPETDVLISAFVVEPDGQISLRTVPIHDRGSLHVRVGRRDFDEKLAKLSAFWHQAVLTRPERDYEVIDLRFDSQIVTKERIDRDASAAG